MSAPASNTPNPPVVASQNATAAPAPSAGPSANVAAGSAQPTARSYASATKKVSSPPIASSGAPPVAVGGPQTAHHGKSSSVSPVNGKNPIQPAIPTMGPAIVNSSASSANHSRKSSVTISAAGPSGYIPNGGPAASRAPSGLTFGAISGSPAPAHATPHHAPGASLNPQAHNPRITSPAHSPSPVPQYSGGKPNNLVGRPEISFGGGESSEPNARANPMPPQPNAIPQAQHLRRESSQSAHSDIGNPAFNSTRGFVPNGGRGSRSFTPGGFNPQMVQGSPQPFRPTPNMRGGGPNNAAPFHPQAQMHPHPNSPYRQTRSPALTPATMQQQAQVANGPGMQYGYPPGQYPQAHPYHMNHGTVDPYGGYYQPQVGYGMAQSIHSMHYGGVPASPGRGHVFPQQMPGQYGMPGPYAPPQQAGGMSMSRTPSQMSERPPSAAAQPSTPAMTNVNHVSHTPTPSLGNSPGPASHNFIPPKKTSKAVVIKNADGEVINFANKKPASPAPPPQPRSPAIVSSPSAPTPPPRAPSATESSHSRTESAVVKTAEEKRAEFQKMVHDNALKDQKDADKKAADEKQAEVEASEKAAKADAEKAAKEEAEKAAKEEAEKIAKEVADKAAKAEEEKANEEAKKAKDAEAEAEAARIAAEEEERMIAQWEAEAEAKEREEEERERAYAAKKALEAEAKKAREAEEKAKEDEFLREQERLADELEQKRAAAGQDSESQALFAGLKKNNQFGPQATAADDSGASTPTAAEPVAEPAAPTPSSTQPKITSAGSKPRPANLKLETTKSVEPPQPSAAMLSLKSARFLQVRDELVNYPDGFKSPNPALNMGAKKGRQYDKDFLLQFQDVFKEKPSTDWDQKLKETVGDSSDSARPQSARPGHSMGSRQPSRGGLPAGGAMGTFGQFGGGGRTLPPGTTSEQRFQQANQGPRTQQGPSMANPLAHLVNSNRTGSFPMARSGSFQNVSQAGPNSPRVGSSRGRGSRRGEKGMSQKEEAQLAKTMPLTANIDQAALKLERSQSGWKPLSLTQPASQQQPVAGHMAPDMVQRKVKAALNKMTPEKFDKIADQILDIAAQSKDENDGRTLRQVIQLLFEKACDEAHWASMYAKFAERMLRTMSPDIKDENVKDKHGQPVVGGALFRKYLLNRCQEEFERGWVIDLPDKPEGQAEVMLSDEYYVAAAAKRKGLGLIQFIGELYKLKMLTLRIMHECVLKLLDFEGLPDESAIESLIKLLRTVGSSMQQEEAGPKMLQVYFERIEKIMNMEGLPSRLHFMLMDIVDLRKQGWRSKDGNKGPKTIAEIREEAAAAQQAAEMERQRSNQRGGPRSQMGRGDARSFSGGGMQPPQEFPSGRVQMDDLRKLSKGASGRNLNQPGQLGPSLLGSRSSSGRRGLGPGGLIGRGDESGASSRTATPPQKDKESTTHMNSFSALAALENEGAGEVGSPPSTTSSPPVQRAAPAGETKDAKPSE